VTFPILSSLVLLPLVGVLALAAVRDDARQASVIRSIALIFSLLEFGETLLLWNRFVPTSAEFQFVERYRWMPAFGIEAAFGVDGISLLLIVLTGFLTPLALLGSWQAIQHRARAFCILVLLLESAMMGVFASTDLFLFYVFWDAVLIPMYFLIGIWGYDDRVSAALKFLLYTLAGSVLMLLAIVMLAYLHQQQFGSYSFNLERLSALRIDFRLQLWLFLAFALAFAIKVPIFPFHTWLPDAHTQAPTAGSVILAGVLLKMGTYGLVRFALPLFPDAARAAAPYLGGLAVVGIVYGALVAMVQPDLKRLVAYSSVSHLGFVVLGIVAFDMQGLQGAVLQMLNHGVSTGGLFLIVGMLSDRRHTRLISEFGGLKSVTPQLVAVFFILTLASIGLPGLNGFVGEFLILLGAFSSHPRLTAVAAVGVVLSATYMLWMFQRVNYGPVSNQKNARLADLTPREWATVLPIVVMCVVMGLWPNVFLRPMAPAVERVLDRVATTEVVQLR